MTCLRHRYTGIVLNMTDRSLNQSPASLALHGVGVSPGIASGPVRIVFDARGRTEERDIAEEEIPGEIARFEDALADTHRQLSAIRQQVAAAIDEHAAAIFDTHTLMIDDASFIEKIVAGLRSRKVNVETVVSSVLEGYIDQFARMEDHYVKERGADIRDLLERILRNLDDDMPPDSGATRQPEMVVARDLLPSAAATLKKEHVLGIVTETGGSTSHAAIVARALGIPAVIGVKDVHTLVTEGDVMLIDGTRGQVVINPSPEQLVQVGHLEKARHEVLDRLTKHKTEPATTQDGCRINVRANIELTDHAELANASGADGIGLFRTEFLFLARPDLPSEEEQVEAYEAVAKAVHPALATIRTLDVGGDKLVTHLLLDEQSDSVLGCRGIRLSLARPDVFSVQLRAILRAARMGNVRIMYPMVSSAEEVCEANALLREVSEALRAEKKDVGAELEIGAMIEIPSAAMTVDLIAPHVRFISLGTNDLVQYTIAVNRLDRQTAALYAPAHPGVLRLIKHTVDSAKRVDLEVAVCGEMASSPLLAPILIGMGVAALSVAPAAVPIIKHIVRSIRHTDATRLAQEALSLPTATAILESCREFIVRNVEDIKELL